MGNEARLLQQKVNTTAADDLALSGTRPSAAMILTVLNKQVIVFHDEHFQPPESEGMIYFVFLFIPQLFST